MTLVIAKFVTHRHLLLGIAVSSIAMLGVCGSPNARGQQPTAQPVERAAQPAASTAAATPLDPSGDDWPTDRGDQAATGATSVQLADALQELWRYDAGQPIEASAVIADETVYAGDVEGTLHAIAIGDGSLRWKQTVDSGYLAPPTVAGDLVVIGDYDGVVRAFRKASGEAAWQYETGAEITGGVTIVGDLVLAASQDGNLYALDRQTGKQVWTYATGDQIRCRPTVAGDRTFLGGCDGALHSVKIADGTSAAEPIPLDGPTGSTPAVIGDRAYLPTQSGAVMAFDWRAGKQLWTYLEDRPQEFRNSAAANAAHVIVASKSRQILALDPQTGNVQWQAALKRRADASPVIAGTDVWVTATDGRIYRFDLETGKEEWQYEIRGAFIAPPAIANQRMVVATDEGVIICFGEKP